MQNTQFIEKKVAPFIEETVKSAHLKWLGKAKTAKINGSEMTVLPYGYLSQAIKEALLAQRTEILKRVEKEVDNLCTKFPISESDEFDDGRESMKREVKEILSANQK